MVKLRKDNATYDTVVKSYRIEFLEYSHNNLYENFIYYYLLYKILFSIIIEKSIWLDY